MRDVYSLSIMRLFSHTHDRENSGAIQFDLGFSHAGNLSEFVQAARMCRGDLGQGSIMKDDVSGNALFARELRAFGAQGLIQTGFTGGERDTSCLFLQNGRGCCGSVGRNQTWRRHLCHVENLTKPAEARS
jgi:hypothetical protein